MTKMNGDDSLDKFLRTHTFMYERAREFGEAAFNTFQDFYRSFEIHAITNTVRTYSASKDGKRVIPSEYCSTYNFIGGLKRDPNIAINLRVGCTDEKKGKTPALLEISLGELKENNMFEQEGIIWASGEVIGDLDRKWRDELLVKKGVIKEKENDEIFRDHLRFVYGEIINPTDKKKEYFKETEIFQYGINLQPKKP